MLPPKIVIVALIYNTQHSTVQAAFRRASSYDLCLLRLAYNRAYSSKSVDLSCAASDVSCWPERSRVAITQNLFQVIRNRISDAENIKQLWLCCSWISSRCLNSNSISWFRHYQWPSSACWQKHLSEGNIPVALNLYSSSKYQRWKCPVWKLAEANRNWIRKAFTYKSSQASRSCEIFFKKIEDLMTGDYFRKQETVW